MSTSLPAFLEALAAELSPGAVVSGADIGARHHSDWTRQAACPPLAVLRPRTTEEVSLVLRRCHAASQPVVVQGGLTGLAGGATPRPGEVALSLERLVGVEDVDTAGGTMRVLAGTPLAVVQDTAERHGLQFPLDLGARGSCSIGGNISTNAGGNRVIRYGMTRALVLGLEAVLADGTVVSSLNAMLKNNAGYDLKQLFVGTEGTLGVVTRAVLRLYPLPGERLTAFVATDSFEALVKLLATARATLGGQLSSFEAMWADYYEYALEQLGVTNRPFAERHPHYALIEVEALDPAHDTERLGELLGQLLADGLAADAVLARSLDEAARLWRVRDAAGELIPRLPNPVAYDISLPIAAMPEYVRRITNEGAGLLHGRPAFVFGHLGDGNLHVISSLDSYADLAAYDGIVYGALAGIGSVSAEHGIGVLKKKWLGLSRQPDEIALMRMLKAALDPRGILNPGRVI
jgi:FAD/FMN-containing dehydrogenase